MGVIGIEEIFLKVRNMDAALEFYDDFLGIHLVLQMENHTGRHQGSGPLHFAMTVEEDALHEIMEKFASSRYFTRGPYGERGKGRALFMIDPDGNEAEINTRYLYGVPQR